MKSETKVKEWDDDYDNKVNDITEIYNPECEAMLRNDVFPTKEFGEIINMHMLNIVLRRGRGTKRTGYIPVVHQDFGRGREAFIYNLKAYGAKFGTDGKDGWPERFDKEEVKNYMMLNFWRPTNMDKALQHQPLALLDPRSVTLDDLVPTGLFGFTPTGMPSS